MLEIKEFTYLSDTILFEWDKLSIVFCLDLSL